MNRKDLRQLASLRLKEAGVLLRNGCPDGAYYIAGYAAECAIKACIAKLTERHDFPDIHRAKESYVHDLNKLIVVADIKSKLDKAADSDPEFAKNWSVVRNWSEQSRYRHSSSADAEELIKALRDPKHGVLKWLKLYW